MASLAGLAGMAVLLRDFAWLKAFAKLCKLGFWPFSGEITGIGMLEIVEKGWWGWVILAENSGFGVPNADIIREIGYVRVT